MVYNTINIGLRTFYSFFFAQTAWTLLGLEQLGLYPSSDFTQTYSDLLGLTWTYLDLLRLTRTYSDFTWAPSTQLGFCSDFAQTTWTLLRQLRLYSESTWTRWGSVKYCADPKKKKKELTN